MPTCSNQLLLKLQHERTTLADRGPEICRFAAVHGCFLPPFPGAVLAGAFFGDRMTEKITEAIKLHLPESMKRDIQDHAMADDRKVSDWIRHVLFIHLYGIAGMKDRERAEINGAMRPEAGQGSD